MDPETLGLNLRDAINTLVMYMIDRKKSGIILEKIYDISRKEQFNVAQTIIKLLSSFDRLEDLIKICVDNAILSTKNDIGLIFRSNSIYVDILSELCKMTCGSLIHAVVKDELWYLVSKKKSERQIRKHSQNILDKILGAKDRFSVSFTRLCSVIGEKLLTKHSEMQLLGISNLIFLRFISPILLDASISLPVAKYPKNMMIMIKNIQLLASSACFYDDSSYKKNSKFISKNLSRMRNFLEVLITGTTNDVPLRQLGYFIFDATLWMEIIVKIGLDTFEQNDWLDLYNTFYRVSDVKNVSYETYIRIIEYYEFSKSKDFIRSLNKVDSFEDYLSSSPETRKRMLTRGRSEPIPTIPILPIGKNEHSHILTVSCSSDRS